MSPPKGVGLKGWFSAATESGTMGIGRWPVAGLIASFEISQYHVPVCGVMPVVGG